MTIETGMNRRSRFVASVLPWLLAATMLGVYLVTMVRTTTPFGLNLLADIAGWDPKHSPFGPVTFLLTYPFRWLPATLVPMALNVFNALLAAFSLGTLARSVALLPHDRTNDQRAREQSDHATLTIRSAWLPPVLAVLICGLQMTFWENATEFRRQSMLDTGEMLNLFMFACIVRCLLEYRITLRESWFTGFALIYGVAMANNWAMIAFFPLFLVAAVWIKGLDFFQWRFVLKTMALGLAGFSLILFLPLLNSVSSNSQAGFWDNLRLVLIWEKNMLVVFGTQFRLPLILLSVFSIFPVLLMGIRWASSFGDNNPLGAFLALSALNIVHGFFLIGCLWVALDPPFGPRRLLPSPFLPFFYLGALSVGYYCGYFLLVFGTRPARTRQRSPAFLRWFGRAVTALVWLVSVAAPIVLIAKNTSQIHYFRSTVEVLNRYFSRIMGELPPAGAVVLSDNSFLLFQLRASLTQSGTKADHLLVDTSAMGTNWAYARRLAAEHPQYKLSNFLARADVPVVYDIDRVALLETLRAEHPLYYLHPSFGYYFERFYSEPHGLVYELKPYPTNSWYQPPLTQIQIAENQAFWKDADGDLRFLVEAREPAADSTNPNPWERILKFARLTTREPDPMAAAMGQYYSRSLNYWGVELNKCGMTNDASNAFELAQNLYSENVAARINRDFVRSQLAGLPPKAKSLKAYDDKLGRHLDWLQVMQECGPFDDPSFCGVFGMIFASGRSYRQALQQFHRAEELTPDSASPSVLLAWIYLYMPFAPTPAFESYPPPETFPTSALAAAEKALTLDPNEPNALFFKGISLIHLSDYEKAVPTFDKLLQVQTTNYLAYLNRAIAQLKLNRFDAARKDYEMVATVAPKAYQVSFGLAEIAYERKETNAAIQNYELYLTNVPPQLKNSDEVKRVEERLKQLKNDQN